MDERSPRGTVIWQVDSLGASVDADLAALGAVREPTDPAAVEVAVVSFGGSRLERELHRLESLRAVCSYGAGYDHLPVDALRARGVRVSNTPDVTNDSVADLAVAAMIDVLRGMSASDRYVRAGGWERGPFLLGRDLSGSRVGVLGLGRIGRAVARRLQGFDVLVGYHNRHEVDGLPYHYFDDLRALAGWADVLAVCTAGGPASEGLVDAGVLSALGPEGVLVNVARASVVDQAAMTTALVDGTLGGAALDVHADEPHVPGALLGLENVLLLPHIGSATAATRAAMGELVVDNVRSWINDGELVTEIPD